MKRYWLFAALMANFAIHPLFSQDLSEKDRGNGWKVEWSKGFIPYTVIPFKEARLDVFGSSYESPAFLRLVFCTKPDPRITMALDCATYKIRIPYYKDFLENVSFYGFADPANKETAIRLYEDRNRILIFMYFATDKGLWSWKKKFAAAGLHLATPPIREFKKTPADSDAPLYSGKMPKDMRARSWKLEMPRP